MHKLNGVTDKMYSCYEEGMKAKGESYVYLCCKNANDLNISEKEGNFHSCHAIEALIIPPLSSQSGQKSQV